MKLPLASALAAVLVGSATAIPQIALAQSSPGEIVVFGTDACPRSTDDEIVVCKRYPETMRYRMPEAYRQVGTKQQRDSWANRARDLNSVGATGTQSCSAVGPGGFTGCLVKEITQAKREAKEAKEGDSAPER